MYLGMKLDQYTEYLNKVIDEVMNPQTRDYGRHALSYLIYSNVEFNIYTQLYSDVVYCVKDAYNQSNYTDKIKVFYDSYIQVNTRDYLDLYYLSYSKYGLEPNYFLNQFNTLFHDIMMLMFLFSTTDIPLNIMKILEELLNFMDTLSIPIEDFMEVINRTFEKFILERLTSLFDSYANVPYDNKLPVITKSLLLEKYNEIITLYKRLIQNLNDKSLKLHVVYNVLAIIKELVDLYIHGVDLNYMFRSYIISAIQHLLSIYSMEVMELNQNNDYVAYITLNNMIVICKRLKVYIPTMFDYNVVKGFI